MTPARIGIGRVGDGLPTRAHLDFQLAHAKARDAVYTTLDARSLGLTDALYARSAAVNRSVYLRRPDLGRRLADGVELPSGPFDVVFVIADGLSALAVERHAVPLLRELDMKGPVVIAEQARVALGDEIGHRMKARLVVVLIGERPGMSAPDSLGVYVTYDPRPGRTDAERNCISNIRAEGLSYGAAALQLNWLIRAALEVRLTGVGLKAGKMVPGT